MKTQIKNFEIQCENCKRLILEYILKKVFLFWPLIVFLATIWPEIVCYSMNYWSYLDGRLVPKISKCHFFQDIQNSFYGVADIVLELHQKKFFLNVSTNMVARGIGSFGTLGGAADPLIE